MSKNIYKYGPGASIHQEELIDNKICYETRIDTLNKSTGINGFLGGTTLEIHGDTATGKTLLTLELIKNAQMKGMKTALFDYDNSFNPNFAEAIGVDLNVLDLITIPIAEYTFELIEKMIHSKLYGVIVIDSLPAILPQSEVGVPFDEIDNTEQSKILNQFLFNIRKELSKTNTLLIFVNQIRDSMSGEKYRTVGGRTFDSFMDVRVSLSKVGDLLDNYDIIGVKTQASIIKNKFLDRITFSKFDIFFDIGVKAENEIHYEINRKKNMVNKVVV